MSQQSSGQKKNRLDFLDGLRGLAAFYVMAGHARWLLWEGYSKGYALHPGEYSRAEKILMYALGVFRYGDAAVLFFFVLSGFVIHLRYSETLQAGAERFSFDWLGYLGRRARRLYPPLAGALFVTWAFDAAGAAAGFRGYYRLPHYLNIDSLLNPSHSLSTLAGNLAFMMNSYVPVWGTNGPLWSLKYEWWFYMLYPFFLLAGRKSPAPPTAAVVLLFGIAAYTDVLGPLFDPVFLMMTLWWMGALLADAQAGRLKIPLGLLSWLIVFLPVALATKSLAFNYLIWGLGFTGALSLFLHLKKQARLPETPPAFKFLGDISYTLYLVHLPFLVFMSGWLVDRSPAQELPRHFGWMALGVALSFLLACAVHFAFERPFQRRR